jgi:preprotein translocase subunit SecG
MSRTVRPVSRLSTLLVLAAVVPLLLAGATLVHTHDGPGIGLYNHEHDLVLMGVLGTVASLPALLAAFALVVSVLIAAAPPVSPDVATRRLDLSRAPPTA